MPNIVKAPHTKKIGTLIIQQAPMVPSEQHSEEQLKHSEELKQSEELKRFQQLRQEQSECPQTAVHFELLLSLAFVSGKCDLSVFLT